jgi:hypothetical protein
VVIGEKRELAAGYLDSRPFEVEEPEGWNHKLIPQQLPKKRGQPQTPRLRRSSEVDHFCSRRVTQTENTIWNSAIRDDPRGVSRRGQLHDSLRRPSGSPEGRGRSGTRPPSGSRGSRLHGRMKQGNDRPPGPGGTLARANPSRGAAKRRLGRIRSDRRPPTRLLRERL